MHKYELFEDSLKFCNLVFCTCACSRRNIEDSAELCKILSELVLINEYGGENP